MIYTIHPSVLHNSLAMQFVPYILSCVYELFINHIIPNIYFDERSAIL